MCDSVIVCSAAFFVVFVGVGGFCVCCVFNCDVMLFRMMLSVCLDTDFSRQLTIVC